MAFSREETQSAFDAVRAMGAKEVEALVRERLGSELMGAFGALAKGVLVNADDEQLSRALHLMVLACAMREKLAAAQPK